MDSSRKHSEPREKYQLSGIRVEVFESEIIAKDIRTNDVSYIFSNAESIIASDHKEFLESVNLSLLADYKNLKVVGTKVVDFKDLDSEFAKSILCDHEIAVEMKFPLLWSASSIGKNIQGPNLLKALKNQKIGSAISDFSSSSFARAILPSFKGDSNRPLGSFAFEDQESFDNLVSISGFIISGDSDETFSEYLNRVSLEDRFCPGSNETSETLEAVESTIDTLYQFTEEIIGALNREELSRFFLYFIGLNVNRFLELQKERLLSGVVLVSEGLSKSERKENDDRFFRVLSNVLTADELDTFKKYCKDNPKSSLTVNLSGSLVPFDIVGLVLVMAGYNRAEEFVQYFLNKKESLGILSSYSYFMTEEFFITLFDEVLIAKNSDVPLDWVMELSGFEMI